VDPHEGHFARTDPENECIGKAPHICIVHHSACIGIVHHPHRPESYNPALPTKKPSPSQTRIPSLITIIIYVPTEEKEYEIPSPTSSPQIAIHYKPPNNQPKKNEVKKTIDFFPF
jgi:hypothetical protein